MSIWTSLLQTGQKLSVLPSSVLGYEFPPLHHDTKMCNAICELDVKGDLLGFRKLKDPVKVIIPVTLYSMKRAGTDAASAPNPLNDKAEYVGNEEYVQLLSAWAEYAAQHLLPGGIELAAVLTYVSTGKFQVEAAQAGISRNSLVCFKVNDVESWKSEELFRSWTTFYSQAIENDPNIRKGLCMITGMEDVLVLKAPKAILQQHPNGKLISCNDKKGFTYRGVMNDPDEVMSIGIKASHYVHQGLKYVFGHGAVGIGRNDWLCVWSPSNPTEICTRELVFGNPDNESNGEATRVDLNKSLYGSKLLNLQHSDTIVTAVIGGATDGRLCVKHFEESQHSQFVSRLNQWHAAFSWELRNSETKAYEPYYPCVFSLVAAAFGRPDEDGKLTVDESMRALWVNRLLDAETKGRPIPQSIVDALVKRANNTANYTDWIIPITLAAMRKQYYDKTGIILPTTDQKEFQKDRSYLYGRLLAVYEKAEQDYLNLHQDKRIPQAKRYQRAFVRNPAKYTQFLSQSYSTVWSKGLYKNQEKRYATAITAIKKALGKENNSPLNPNYLFGYYSERKRQYTKQFKGDIAL